MQAYAGTDAMPINRMLQREVFDPEQCQAMGSAYEAILRELKLTDRNDPLCGMLAEKVIELGKAGERDPNRLRERAMVALRL